MSNRRKLLLLAFHVALGIVVVFSGQLVTLYSLGILAMGVWKVVNTQNREGQAHLFAAYLVGLEVFLRMTNASVVWEFGKYAAIALLLPGCFYKKGGSGKKFWLVISLMIPSILVTDFPNFHEFRTGLSFNLSGIFLIATAGYYFYNRRFGEQDLKELLFWFILPLVTTLTYLSWQAPDLDAMEFGWGSEGGFSAGFGANQVSNILGAGMVALALAYLKGLTLTPYRWLDYGLFFLMAFRGLMTFSRGGMIGAGVAIVIALISLGITKNRSAKSNNLFLTLILLIGLGGAAWNIINEASGGKLMLRYQGETLGSYKYSAEKNVTTGRVEIYKRKWEVFKNNFLLGIGPGMYRYHITDQGRKTKTPHAEYTRLLSAHGVFGLIAIFLLLLWPANRFFSLTGYNKAWLAGLVALALFTMSHSAMRLAFIAYFYGLSMIVIEDDQSKHLNRQ